MKSAFDKAVHLAKIQVERDKLDSEIFKLNNLLADADAKAADIQEVRDNANEICKGLNGLIASLEYHNLADTPQPMLALLTQLRYTTHSVVEVVDKESHSVSAEVRDRQTYFDIARLVQVKPESVSDKTWQYQMNKMNVLLSMRVSDDLKTPRKSANVNGSVIFDNLLKEYERTPIISNNELCKQMKVVFRSLLGDEAEGRLPTKADVRFILYGSTQAGREPLTIRTLSGRRADQVLMQALHAILLGKGYTNESQMKDKKSKKGEQESKIEARGKIAGALMAPKAEVKKTESESKTEGTAA